MSADGKVLAETVVDAAGNETRKYPYGNMYAHVVGFSTNGKSGIESNMNFNLLRSHSFVLERMFNEIKDEKSMGDNVVTTLDSTLPSADIIFPLTTRSAKVSCLLLYGLLIKSSLFTV